MTDFRGRPRWPWWAAASLLVVYTALSLVTRLPGVGVGNDDAMYLFLARSLLQGSYRDIFLPDAPFHLQYPPGWPLLLAVPLAIVGDRPGILLLLPLALSLGGLVLLFDCARRLLPPIPALCVLGVAAFNPLLLTYGGRLKAEAALFFFAMLALWCLRAPDASRRRLMIGAAAAIAAAFMRTAGIAVIAAVFVHFVLARQWRWVLGFGSVAALTFGPWLAWSFLGPRQLVGRSYAGDLATIDADAVADGRHPLLGRALAIVNGAQVYLLGHLHAMMGFKQATGTLADNVGWVALLATAGTAGLVTLWRRFRIAVLATVLMFAVLFVWAWADRRFLHPLIPLVGLILITGADTLGRRVGRLGTIVAPLLVVGLLVPGTWWRTEDLVRHGWNCVTARNLDGCYTPKERAFLQASLAARSLPSDAVALVDREAAFAYHSGRAGVFAHEGTDFSGEDFLAFLERRGVTHVLVSRVTGFSSVRLADQLVSVCRRLDVVGDFGEGTVLFGVRPKTLPPRVAEQPPACPLAAGLHREAVNAREERIRARDHFELPGRESP
ncbi:MAG: hypothetical protein ACKVZ0_07995 [Gemmatimonadales bacterium]